jgi:N-acetyl sugar amidotransferase
LPPRYCRTCILPDARPGVALDATGECRACRNAVAKRHIDWNGRRASFQALAGAARSRAKDYDCVIPVSGGKDSFWQVVTCREHGLRPLCVTYRFPRRSALGEANLRRLVALGVDHEELVLDPGVERAFIAKAFREVGISGLVAHMAIYAWPLRVAVERDIPLVVYGENSAFEYGGDDDTLMGDRVDQRWIDRFGVTAGTTAHDWIDDTLTPEHLEPLFHPSDAALAAKDIRALFLGHYFEWDPPASLGVARAHGFEARPEGARVGHLDFVNVDDDMIGVHHHPKWHKFGITRSFDTLSVEIRAGRMSRDEAIAHLARRGDETPWDDIRVFCGYLGITIGAYFEILERFRNRSIWSRSDGRWRIDGFLVPDFQWPCDPAEVA